MSLVGNLEDLGLGDILQIVSLSRKSGVLALHSRGREGQIVFRQGQVVRVSSSTLREHLGDVLMRRGLIDLDTLRRALVIQKSRKTPVLLGSILEESFSIPRSAIEEIVKGQIQQMVTSFFGWTEGSFSFELGQPEDQLSTQFNPLQFMLEHGLNPQWLAMEGSRLYDEKLHRGEPLDEESPGSSGTPDALLAEPRDQSPASLGAVGLPLLLVDDDGVTRQVLQTQLQAHGFAVQAVGSGQAFFEAVAAICQQGERPLVLLDLVMPRGHGGGVLGGLDILQRLRTEHPEVEVLVMSDYPSADAAEELQRLGIGQVLTKPRKSEFANGQAGTAVDSLIHAVVEWVAATAGAGQQHPGTVNLGAELLREMGEGKQPPNLDPVTPGLGQLKGMLQELSNPALGGGIVLLVLRFASEFMNRGVVFRVQENGTLVGLGQFGLGAEGCGAEARIRNLRLQVQQGSLLAQALHGQRALKGALGPTRTDMELKERLGGGTPGEVFLGPLVSEGTVVALVYGDNLPEDRPLGNTESLEIFLSQAGVAMEKALLERRLKSGQPHREGV
jgi:CheY-like chemotaxis protein